MRLPFQLSIALLLLALPLLAQAKPAYITDTFKVTMRSGESSTHRILRMLNSGDQIDLLSTNSESGYSKIRTASGLEGYVLSRQLMSQPSARNQLKTLQQRVHELESAPAELSGKLARLQRQHDSLLQEHKALQQTRNQLNQELQSIQRTASNAIRISNERNDLRKQVADLTRNVADLRQQNRDLSNESNRDWFLIGAAVVIAGILIGLLLPHLRFQRRRNNWGAL
ncbi:SH3 domain protein [endosymbiont of Ridgeia piscesae]|jgi:SH3 domain protein|uniref:SH3 domain protein n=2 Tax=endosymbiont of Ridgeia piscesae TaxID=54398 RepID=A0A0T5YUK6_9GAMM|nr:TIGR04211 family SH3 domain-containing protein [endosymbiont of Ridgeia piscesae]KRT54265.1 SH3 domain protein [endosymbiont of Ridgeia piscesae]